MTTIYTFDGDKIYSGVVEVDPLGPVPPGALTPPPETTGQEVAMWVGSGWAVLPERPAKAPEPPVTAPTRTRADVLAELASIDMRSIRALRESNATRIAELEAQAVALRLELSGL
jgi:hypothetical protein